MSDENTPPPAQAAEEPTVRKTSPFLMLQKQLSGIAFSSVACGNKHGAFGKGRGTTLKQHTVPQGGYWTSLAENINQELEDKQVEKQQQRKKRELELAKEQEEDNQQQQRQQQEEAGGETTVTGRSKRERETADDEQQQQRLSAISATSTEAPGRATAPAAVANLGFGGGGDPNLSSDLALTDLEAMVPSQAVRGSTGDGESSWDDPTQLVFAQQQQQQQKLRSTSAVAASSSPARRGRSGSLPGQEDPSAILELAGQLNEAGKREQRPIRGVAIGVSSAAAASTANIPDWRDLDRSFFSTRVGAISATDYKALPSQTILEVMRASKARAVVDGGGGGGNAGAGGHHQENNDEEEEQGAALSQSQHQEEGDAAPATAAGADDAEEGAAPSSKMHLLLLDSVGGHSGGANLIDGGKHFDLTEEEKNQLFSSQEVLLAADVSSGTAAKHFNVVNRAKIADLVEVLPASRKNLYAVVDPELPCDPFFDIDAGFESAVFGKQIKELIQAEMTSQPTASSSDLAEEAAKTKFILAAVDILAKQLADFVASEEKKRRLRLLGEKLSKVFQSNSSSPLLASGPGSFFSTTTTGPDVPNDFLQEGTATFDDLAGGIGGTNDFGGLGNNNSYYHTIPEQYVKLLEEKLPQGQQQQQPQGSNSNNTMTTGSTAASTTSQQQQQIQIILGHVNELETIVVRPKKITILDASVPGKKWSFHLHFKLEATASSSSAETTTAPLNWSSIYFDDIHHANLFASTCLAPIQDELKRNGYRSGQQDSSTNNIHRPPLPPPGASPHVTQQSAATPQPTAISTTTTTTTTTGGGPATAPTVLATKDLITSHSHAVALLCTDLAVYNKWRCFRLPFCAKRTGPGQSGRPLIPWNPPSSTPTTTSFGGGNSAAPLIPTAIATYPPQFLAEVRKHCGLNDWMREGGTSSLPHLVAAAQQRQQRGGANAEDESLTPESKILMQQIVSDCLISPPFHEFIDRLTLSTPNISSNQMSNSFPEVQVQFDGPISRVNTTAADGSIIRGKKAAFAQGLRVGVTELEKRALLYIFQQTHPQHKSNITSIRAEYEDNGFIRGYYVYQKQSRFCIMLGREHSSTFAQLYVTYGSVKVRCYSNDCATKCGIISWSALGPEAQRLKDTVLFLDLGEEETNRRYKDLFDAQRAASSEQQQQ